MQQSSTDRIEKKSVESEIKDDQMCPSYRRQNIHISGSCLHKTIQHIYLTVRTYFNIACFILSAIKLECILVGKLRSIFKWFVLFVSTPTLRERQRLRVLNNKLLREIFGPGRRNMILGKIYKRGFIICTLH
jgi:hypothetical protein